MGVGRRCGVMVLVLSPGCHLVVMVARVPRQGSGASIDVVSGGYPRGVVGGSNGAQPLGLGPQLSPDSCHRGLLFVVNGV